MIAKKFCPNCGSEDVEMVAAGTTGSWVCRDCGYNGIFPEKTLIGSEEDHDKKHKEGGHKK